MKREEFLVSQQLQIKLISTEKKMMQLRTRYVIEVITDKRVQQVRKTFRQFQYFNKILQKKLGMKDKQLYIGKHLRSANKYTDLQFFIHRLNSGYLIYKQPRDGQQRRNADLSSSYQKPQQSINNELQLQPSKTRQLRSYLYDLLFREDELFIDGVDEDSPFQQEEISNIPPDITSIRAQFKKQDFYDLEKQKSKSKQKKKKSQSENHSPSKNPFKRLWYASNYNADRAIDKIGQLEPAYKAIDTIQRTGMHAMDLKSAIIYDKSKPRQKSSEQGKLSRALKNMAFKAKNAGSKVMNVANLYENYAQTKNLKQILKKIQKCWIKFPNNYNTRDRNIIYKPYVWQPYDIKLSDNLLQFTNTTTLHRHRKVFIIFQSDVQINFQNYTKIVVKNKIDKNPLQIRLSLSQEPQQQITQQYLALYTYIKQVVKKQQEKLKMFSTLDIRSKVCNKVRIRINLKQKHIGRAGSIQGVPLPNEPLILDQQKGSKVYLNFPHVSGNQYKKQQFQFKALKQASSNVKTLSIKIIHSSIQAFVTLSMDTYVDIDFPIIDNFGALDIIVDQVQKQNGGFLPNISSKDPLCTLHVPVQTIYDYMYNQASERRRFLANTQLKKKMIEIKHTKAHLTLDYKCIGNYYALCSYNESDIFQDDQPPEQFNRDQFRMNNNRLKRIIWSIQLYTDKLKDLQNFTYPNLSYLFYIVLAFACIFYDNNNYFLWVLIFTLSLLIYNSPFYSLYIKDITDFLKLEAKKKNLDVFLFKKNKLIQQQYVVPMKKQAKRQFLLQFQLTRKIKRSIYKKYKRLLQVLLQAQILLTKFTSFVQKIKNIFIWYHYQKTKIFFMIIAGLLIALLVLPIRFILFAVILKQMKKGSKYHANVQDINRVIIIQLLRIIIRQSNLVYMGEFFREHFRPLDLKNAQTHVFFKTCDDLLSKWLEVRINMDAVCKKSINMSQFVTNLSKCKQKYRILPQVCQKYGFSLEWSKTQNSLKKFFDLIYGFIITIPSDKYIMGVKTITNNQEEQMQEVQNIIDRELLNF